MFYALLHPHTKHTAATVAVNGMVEPRFTESKENVML
jgi:hypothetical protein